MVRGVEAATPAEKAGLEKYDVITKVDGQDVSSTTDLQSALYKKKVGDKMEVTYYRGSKEMKATIDLTIDKSALTQQNNRSNKERNDLLFKQQVVSFFILLPQMQNQLLHQKAILRFLFSWCIW